MLDQLARYAEREGLVTEPGFAPKDVKWSILIEDDGRVVADLVPIGDPASKKGHRFMRAPNLSLGEMKRGGAGTRHFLADALEVVLGLGAEDDPKIAAKHDFFLGLLERAEAVVPEVAVAATALRDSDLRGRLVDAAAAAKAKPGDTATFAVRQTDGGIAYPLEDDAWHGLVARLPRHAATAAEGGPRQGRGPHPHALPDDRRAGRARTRAAQGQRADPGRRPHRRRRAGAVQARQLPLLRPGSGRERAGLGRSRGMLRRCLGTPHSPRQGLPACRRRPLV